MTKGYVLNSDTPLPDSITHSHDQTASESDLPIGASLTEITSNKILFFKSYVHRGQSLLVGV
jgi:hypothetical protein